MAMIHRLLLAIAASFLGLAGTVQAGAIAVAPASAATPAYAYDAAHYASGPTATASERGPPVAYERVTTDDAVDRWSHGHSARGKTALPPGSNTYDHPALLVQVASALGTTQPGADGDVGGLSPLSAARSAANAGEDTVSLFKASQRGLGESHYANGYKPGDFPGNGAYFAREKEIADSYAVHYGEGVIETRVPRGVYDEHFAQLEMNYLGSPPGTELAILNRPGSDGGSFYWIPTPAGSASWAA